MRRSKETEASKQLARAGGPLTVDELPEATQDRIRHFQAAAQASNTSTAYRVQLRLFQHWCKQHRYSDAPPVAAAIVAAWLTERAAAGSSRSTLTVGLAAIKAGHRAAKQRFDSADPTSCGPSPAPAAKPSASSARRRRCGRRSWAT